MAWSIYQKIIAAYGYPDRRRGKRALAAVIDSIRCGVPTGPEDIAQLGRTLWRRRHDILAFFDHHASNGPTEAINGRLVRHYDDPEEWMFTAWMALTDKGEQLARSLEEAHWLLAIGYWAIALQQPTRGLCWRQRLGTRATAHAEGNQTNQQTASPRVSAIPRR